MAYLTQATRLTEQVGDNLSLGRALLNLADTLAATDPAAAADVARAAAGHLRQVGARSYLAYAIGNLIQALLALGDWDGAERELIQAVDADGLATSNTSPATGSGWQRCAATLPPPRPRWRNCRICAQAKITRQGGSQLC